MGLVTDTHREKIRQVFAAGLKGSVHVLFFHDEEKSEENEYVGATREIVTELTGISNGLITMREINAHEYPDETGAYGIDKFPALAFLDGQGRDQNIRIYGAPIGYEFAALLEDLIDISQGQTRLSEAARSQIKGIEHEVIIQVFSTPG